jgi:L-alanine-DL-glutamate epimerase-like enolase superfamily enzyme
LASTRIRTPQGQADQKIVAGRCRLRIDANQGYDREHGCASPPRSIRRASSLEQPCAAGDWDAARAVAAVSPVPMMLDESIYGMDDIERAARLEAARFIKLKLMKMGSLDALARGIRRIRELGMEPVLGNGVACEVGCWMEACIARTLITNAGEMNGFLKPVTRLLADPCDSAARWCSTRLRAASGCACGVACTVAKAAFH